MSHNLDISMYSFKEVLDLFDLNDNFNTEDLKRAKKKVLMIHPDKSNLPSEYFLFYKKAYEIIYHFFEENIKQSKAVPTEKMEYNAMNTSDEMKSQINKSISSMKSGEFNKKFNEVFDKNMSKSIENKNEWFQKNEALYEESVTSKGNIGQAMNRIREQNSGLVRYNGIQTLNGGGTNLYDDDSNSYISCDPFSKLKFDDLRKVHKDETIFSVNENDINNMKTYSTMENLKQDRERQTLTPMEKMEAEKIMDFRRKEKEHWIREKQYESSIKSMENQEKSKSVLSSFLRLTN
jgi:hypothetical protein